MLYFLEMEWMQETPQAEGLIYPIALRKKEARHIFWE